MKPYFSEEASNLLRGLMEQDPSKRIGSSEEDAKEIMRHGFFATIDWLKLAKRELAAPFKPKITSDDDYKNFDPMFLNEDVKDTPADAIIDKKASNFDGFTFNADKMNIEMNHLRNHKL